MVGGVWAAAANRAVTVSGSVAFTASHVDAKVWVVNSDDSETDSVEFKTRNGEVAPEQESGVIEDVDVQLSDDTITDAYVVHIEATGLNQVFLKFTADDNLPEGFSLVVSASEGLTVESGVVTGAIAAGDEITITVTYTVDPALVATTGGAAENTIAATLGLGTTQDNANNAHTPE